MTGEDSRSALWEMLVDNMAKTDRYQVSLIDMVYACLEDLLTLL